MVFTHRFNLNALGIMLDFKDQMMMWDESTIHMKDLETLLDLISLINNFYWHEECLESQALREATSCLKKILDAKYEPADLDVVMWDCTHLSDDEQA